MSTAVGTMDFNKYYDLMKYFILFGISSSLIMAILGLYKAKWIKSYIVLFPVLMAFGYLGFFERVREFVRKPYVIGGYMYSNLLLEEDYPVYQQFGLLKNATYTTVTEITPENKIEAGRNVFAIACSRCHTAQGVNSVVYVFERMYGIGKPLDINSMASYIPNMHNGRTYMPPFPGTQEESEALAAYIRNIQETGDVLEGAQSEGVNVSELQNTQAVITNKK
ncbi:c-type cytochrome [Flavobacterium sp. FlaQc-51]|uniref:c-type cytochrome n=1 Tax=Flavobacterium sp. FlaQc-51 TaxID=3374184 RepID=UPI0037566938